MEDTEIVDLYWQRSDLAISETDKKYGRYCKSIAYRILASQEDAEECVSDTWFRARNLMPDKRPPVLSVFFEGDQEGAPMYIELGNFPNNVVMTIGNHHSIG